MDIEPCSEGGVSVGWCEAGEWLEYTVDVASAGTYAIELRVASPNSGTRLHVEFNRMDKTGSLTVPNTGDWMNWQTLTKTGVSLSAGQQILRIACDTSGFNVNWIRVTGSVTSGAGMGLTGEYFDNIDFTALRVTRTDATVNFDWSGGSPDGSIGADTFSVRWTGRIQAQFSQTYTFYTVSDDGIRLWINGQLVINNWSDHPPTENSGSIALSAGQNVDLKMEFYENGGGATAKLLWESPVLRGGGRLRVAPSELPVRRIGIVLACLLLLVVPAFAKLDSAAWTEAEKRFKQFFAQAGNFRISD